MIILSRDQILLMHHALIERYGGIHGIRDEGLLNSALNAPFQTFDNKDLYPTIAEKAVRLGYGLVMNHPFHDGNKQIVLHFRTLPLPSYLFLKHGAAGILLSSFIAIV